MGLHRDAIRHQRYVQAGSPHIVGDEISDLVLSSDGRRRDDARRGTRQHRLNGVSSRFAGRDHAAVGLHDEQMGTVSPSLQAAFQVGQISADDGLDVRVDDGRAGAFEFTNQRKDLRGRNHVDFRIVVLY